MNNFEWENSFPNSCPVYGATSYKFYDVYRLVKNKSPKENEFYPNNKSSGAIKNNTDCKRWAVSFFEKYDNADFIRQTVPYFKNHHIAQGDLLLNFGTSLVEKDGHICLWRFKNTQISSHFRVIKNEHKYF
ncbi:MAG: hypothetical protein QM652_02775 [Legionella sp.]|uniref:hypothetical protein n=1 Tax=Legionella sp. TaxID=459 RepID=UPI0039E63FE5